MLVIILISAIGRISGGGTPDIKWAYSDTQSMGLNKNRDATVLFCQNNKIVKRLLSSGELQQYLPRSGDFLFRKNTSILRFNNGKFRPVCDFAKWVTMPSDQDRMCVAMSTSGNEIAISRPWSLNVVNLRTGKPVASFAAKGILKNLQALRGGIVLGQGLAWSNDGAAIAFSTFGNVKSDSDDGASAPNCAVAWRTGKWKIIGDGAPVAWLNKKSILCEKNVNFETEVQAEIYDLSKGTVRRSFQFGDAVGWNGKCIILAQSHKLLLLDPNTLKTLAVVKAPFYATLRAFYPQSKFLGIPDPYIKGL